MRFIPALAAASIQAALLASCWAAGPQAALPPGDPGSAPATACSDFDEYVNGRWRASIELPPAKTRIGSFDDLRAANDRLLERALAALATDAGKQSTPALKLLASYYRSGMDEAGIERAGLRSVAPLLARIDGVTGESLPALLADLARLQVPAPLAIGVGVDAKDATRHVLGISQAGLGLPDRDDYAKTDATTQRIKAAYRLHAATLLKAASGKDAAVDEATIDALLAFENALATASMTRVQRRDPNASYNPITVAALQAQAPGLDWSALLAGYAGRTEGVPIILGQPAFAQAVAKLAQTADLATWRNYLRVRLLDTVAAYGPKVLADSHFAYQRGALRGQKAKSPRVEDVILAIGGPTGGAPLSESLGQLFAKEAFSSLAQQRALQMLDDIKAGMRQRVAASPWMTPATQALALQKLEAMTAKIGVPERWKSFDGLQLSADDYIGNLLRTNAWATAERLPDLARPVDRTRWNTSPHIVNAFAGGGNQIVFPAGILQPPFFDAKADDASNFGGIGMVIGHEITHHFDDRGRQFDAVGNLRDWWQAADASAYKQRADRVAALYSSYEPLAGERIDGRLTLGENLSDVGGMQIAFAGLQIALERQRKAGKPAPLVDGQTPEQRFFLANAVVWRTKYRNEALVNQLRTDSHSPGRWRVLGPMSQMAAFAQAFSCKAGDAMVAGDPIVVW
jgi:predicted metalloendopeptidase